MNFLARSGFDQGVLLERDPVRLRHARRLLNQALHQTKIPKWAETFEYHTRSLLRNLVREPALFLHHIRQYVLALFGGCEEYSKVPDGRLSAGVTIEVSHGHRITSPDDDFVGKADVTCENFGDASLMHYAADWFPCRASSQ